MESGEAVRVFVYVHSGGHGMHMVFFKIFSLVASHDDLGGHSEGGAKFPSLKSVSCFREFQILNFADPGAFTIGGAFRPLCFRVASLLGLNQSISKFLQSLLWLYFTYPDLSRGFVRVCTSSFSSTRKLEAGVLVGSCECGNRHFFFFCAIL